jgi:DNA repair photolyase
VFVRWDNLTTEQDAATRLPGYRDPAVVRRFDAPEALDVRFYEVHAKSALNRVPAASRMPFRWTVNPYRGCSHACVYCLDGETPILMADRSHRPLAKLRVGDEIYGTELRGKYRRYVRTRVLAHWASVKPAHRVTLKDGTELIASANHQFLTDSGWLHVAEPEQPAEGRPRLTTASSLLGTGQFATGPQHSGHYERGYLCGMIRGGDNLASHVYDRSGGPPSSGAPQFRLALVDGEALYRTQRFLLAHGVHTTSLPFDTGSRSATPIHVIGAQSQSESERIGALVAWPLVPSDEWRKGFLAGVFDAEGSGGRVIRISNADETVLRWIESSMDAFGFRTVLEGPSVMGISVVRLWGGLRERLRFFHLVDPAIRRKLTIDDMAVKSSARTAVASVEPLGMAMRLYDITTGTGDFIANGVVSHNCFARPTHTYLDFDAGRDFEREIVVKVNAPEVVRAELARRSWKGEHVAMGTNTDPYQWVESRYKLMPGIWEAMRDARNPCSILTKSPLLLRDLELMREIAAVTDIHANLSIPTLDAKAWRATEPHTPHPKARLEAVAELNRAGIPTGVLVAPLMPGINDAPEQVQPLLEAAAAAGATGIGGIALHLRGEVRQIYMDWLRSYRPELVALYEELYARGAYAPPEERRRLAALLSHPGVPPPSRFRLRDSAASNGGTPEPDRPSEPRTTEVQATLF